MISFEDVVALTYHQRLRSFHPYTCRNRDGHPVIDTNHGVLVPTVRGWICQFCDYTQEINPEMVSQLRAVRDA